MRDFIATTAKAHWQVRCGTSWREHAKLGQSFVLMLLQGARLVCGDTITEQASVRSPRRQSRRHDDPPRESIMGWGRSVGKRRRRFQH